MKKLKITATYEDDLSLYNLVYKRASYMIGGTLDKVRWDYLQTEDIEYLDVIEQAIADAARDYRFQAPNDNDMYRKQFNDMYTYKLGVRVPK